MENHVDVTICDQEYRLVAEESAAYMERIAAYVGEKMSALLSGSHVGRTGAAVLTAVNITDELFKEREASGQLRVQIRQLSDEAGKAEAELSELKREVFRLQQKLEGKNRGKG